MSLTVLGERSITALNPLSLQLAAGVTAGIGPLMLKLQAELNGLLAAQLDLSLNLPSLAGIIANAQALIASVELLIAQGIPLPSISLQLTAILEAILSIQASLGQLTLMLSLAATISETSATVTAVVYEGPAANAGTEIGNYFGSGIDGGGPNGQALILAIGASSAASRAAMGAFFGVGVST